MKAQMQGFKMLAVLAAMAAFLAGAHTTVLGGIVLQDDFNDGDLAGWTSTPAGEWSNPGTEAVSSTTPGTSLSRPLSITVVGDWRVDLRYGWFGANGSTAARNGFAMLDGTGSGYGVYIQQNSGAGSIGIEKYTLGAFAGGTYFTKPVSEFAADLTPIALDRDGDTGLLSLYLGLPGGAAGTASTLIGTITDTDYSSFTQFQLDNRNALAFQSIFDDVLIVPEPTSVALVVCGSVFLLIRRRSVRN
jgi:hypothetical protein